MIVERVEQQKDAPSQETAPKVHMEEIPWEELKECQKACQEALSALNRIRGIDENVKLLYVTSDTTAGQSKLMTVMEEAAKRGERI